MMWLNDDITETCQDKSCKTSDDTYIDMAL